MAGLKHLKFIRVTYFVTCPHLGQHVLRWVFLGLAQWKKESLNAKRILYDINSVDTG